MLVSIKKVLCFLHRILCNCGKYLHEKWVVKIVKNEQVIKTTKRHFEHELHDC
jgi:hypothetical protein